MVLFASIFRSYAKTIIVLEGAQVFDAIKKKHKSRISQSLTLTKIGARGTPLVI